jgi:Trypsin-co-occurring domain 1
VAVLLQLPLGEGLDGANVLVEADRTDIAEGLTHAAAQPGKAAAKATESLSESLERLEPLLRTVKDTLVAAAPEHFSVEFD